MGAEQISKVIDADANAKANAEDDEDYDVKEPDYVAEGTERMQLNPSTDLYDDDDDDDEREADDDDDDYDESLYDDDDDDDDDEEPENLPEAKSLVQPPAKEEEDMGYDEDDERLALERPQTATRNKKDEDFMNEEGSGGSIRQRFKPNEHIGIRVSHFENIRKKLLTENSHSHQAKPSGDEGEVDLRESSGNFANDDEDGDGDDDDDDDDDDHDGDDDDGGANGQSYDYNGEPRTGFFNSKRKSSSNHYFRKNTNDAIKIISTPLGKVGIVYQQTPTGEEKTNENADKKTSSFTDFDALAPDPESSHRLASSHPKITPVLTPDGKVALLYRGDSENSKYEPIRNLTHKFNNNNNNNGNNKNNESTDNKTNKDENRKLDKTNNNNNNNEDNDSASDDSSYTDNEDDNLGPNNEKTAVDKQLGSVNEADGLDGTDDRALATEQPYNARVTDSVLPMINRPLSEVLGIKKNQFKQIRVKDTPLPTTSTEALPRSLAGIVNIEHTDTTTLHFLTKVNLAEYPTSARTHNRDFDFSRDNTMLDERTRHREQQSSSSAASSSSSQHNEAASITENSVANTIANEEILSKTEVVNLAIIPHFDEDLERLQRLHMDNSRRHHRARHRQKQTEEDLSGIHCIMQVMMGIAAISTVFGMLGTFFKQRILDQLRLMHW